MSDAQQVLAAITDDDTDNSNVSIAKSTALIEYEAQVADEETIRKEEAAAAADYGDEDFDEQLESELIACEDALHDFLKKSGVSVDVLKGRMAALPPLFVRGVGVGLALSVMARGQSPRRSALRTVSSVVKSIVKD